MNRQADCVRHSLRMLPRFTKATPHNHEPLPDSRQGFSRMGGTMMEREAWDSMKPADVTAFLEFCEGKLIDFEDAAARGELGAAKKAATLRRMLGSSWPPIPSGGRSLLRNSCQSRSRVGRA
jgi:hypothetical protein